MYPAASHVAGRILSSRTEGGYIIATLAGDLDIAAAPMLRDKLLVMLDPAASRLIIDLSATRYADASGLAVLISTGRRARLLGGFLRLAAPSPQVTDVLSITGLSRHLATFPTVHAAINSPPRSQRRHDGGTEVRANIGTPSATQAQPAGSHAGMAWRAADHGELRMAVAALLTHADAWRALHALALAHSGTSHAALTQAAHGILSVLTRQPLTHSPAVAATASRLRLLLDPYRPPAHT